MYIYRTSWTLTEKLRGVGVARSFFIVGEPLVDDFPHRRIQTLQLLILGRHVGRAWTNETKFSSKNVGNLSFFQTYFQVSPVWVESFHFAKKYP